MYFQTFLVNANTKYKAIYSGEILNCCHYFFSAENHYIFEKFQSTTG